VPGTYHSEVQALIDVSARLGRNPLLVQAGSGNTSVKVDGALWIKASGKWLAHAAQEEIFVPVDLSEVKACVHRGTDFVAQHGSLAGHRLEPSIETAMHAVIPHLTTIHVHSVNAIAWAVGEDGPAELAARLVGLRWQWVRYVASGLPLALEVEKTFADSPETEILVLGNHGLVVCGETAVAAEEMLLEVERRLAIEPRATPEVDRSALQRLICGSEWCVPDLDSVHSLSTDAISRAILLEGILYPCQAIFLGPKTPLWSPCLPISDAVQRYECFNGACPRFFLVESCGVIVRKTMTCAEREMLVGLAEVTRRIDAGTNIRYLAESELAGVLSGETYRYRELVESNKCVTQGQPAERFV
jgi:rhamnose utilization protein RhaD (predicted bifunctional aldolase and dehydrogenase)